MTATTAEPGPKRLPTRVPGLDSVLRGGLLQGDTYLVSGAPGTGKTTLGNQLAFAHASVGGNVIFATLLTESHDHMLAHLRGMSFFDHTVVGSRIQYVSLLSAFLEGDLESTMRILVDTMRSHQATLLVIDGAGAARHFADADVDYLRFVHGLAARAGVLGCTTVLLAADREAHAIATHVDGVIALTNDSVDARDARWLRVVKLRGSTYLNGRHRFSIDERGVVVSPRIEVAYGQHPPAWHDTDQRLAFGIPSLDAMLGGGLSEASTTMVLGTAGAGKTLAALHFLAEGARRGDRGLIATFHEIPPVLASTAARAGINIGSHLESGLLQVLWHAPLELTPDAWAAELLAQVDAHKPHRLVIDAFSDLTPLFDIPERRAFFAPALANALRDRGVTTLVLLEIDAYASSNLTVPVPNLSAAMDNLLLLRTVELRSSLRRVVSVLKQRQTGFDPSIREFTIGASGITVGDPLDATDPLTGPAPPDTNP